MTIDTTQLVIICLTLLALTAIVGGFIFNFDSHYSTGLPIATSLIKRVERKQARFDLKMEKERLKLADKKHNTAMNQAEQERDSYADIHEIKAKLAILEASKNSDRDECFCKDLKEYMK